MNPHTKLIRECLQVLHLNGIEAWENKTGNPGGRRRHKGRVGSSDIIGWVQAPIMEEVKEGVKGTYWVVVNTLALFFSLEIKTGDGKLSQEQLEFLEKVQRDGGIGLEVRRIEDLKPVLDVKKAHNMKIPIFYQQYIPRTIWARRIMTGPVDGPVKEAELRHQDGTPLYKTAAKAERRK